MAASPLDRPWDGDDPDAEWGAEEAEFRAEDEGGAEEEGGRDDADDRTLDRFGLPAEVVEAYRAMGIERLLEWQAQTLRLENGDVLAGRRNVVLSAPTSGGKTIVAEILMLQVRPLVSAARPTLQDCSNSKSPFLFPHWAVAAGAAEEGADGAAVRVARARKGPAPRVGVAGAQPAHPGLLRQPRA